MDTKEGEEFKTDEILLQDLRSEYRNGFELKSSLDTKASSIITASIISSSLLVSITALFLTSIEPVNSVSPSVIGLTLGVSLSVITILFSMEAYRIKYYMYSIVSSKYFDGEGNYIECNVEDIRKSDKKEFYTSRIEDYLHALNHNEKENAKRAKKIIVSQYLFIISIGLLLGSILLLLGLILTGSAIIKP